MDAGSVDAGNPLPGPVADASLAIGPTQVFLVGGTNGKITLRSVMRAQIQPDGKLGPWVMLPICCQIRVAVFEPSFRVAVCS